MAKPKPQSPKTHFKLSGRSYCGADRGENSATKLELCSDLDQVTCRSCRALVKKGQGRPGKGSKR